jgi:hypothetical protein
MTDIDKCCGTCARWQQDKQENRPKKIRTMFVGICGLDGKSRDFGAMTGCFGWKEADPWVIEARGKDGII